MAASPREGACVPRVRATYWTTLLALIAFGLLRLLVLGNPIEGIAVLLFSAPGALALLGLWGPTMRVWHVGGSLCWVGWCAFNIYELAHAPASLNWVIYIGSGVCALLSLVLCLALFLAATPNWSAWRKGANGPLLPQNTVAEPLNAADEQPVEGGGEPLVWPPPHYPGTQATLSAADQLEEGQHFVNSGRSAQTPAVWPPPGYTGN